MIFKNKNATYVLFSESDFQSPLSLNLRSEILKVEGTPDIIYWDDLCFEKKGRIRIQPLILSLPVHDSYLNHSIDLSERFVIRSDLLDSLANDPLERRQQIIDLLAQSKRSSFKIKNVFRFVGFNRSVYAPRSLPTPKNTTDALSIIVNYRDRPELMEDFLKTLREQKTNKSIEVIMVNNQSTSDNFAKVQSLAKELLPDSFKVVHTTYDAPFNLSHQNNIAAELATGEVLFFINNDAHFMGNNVLDVLADWAMEPNVSTVGPKFYGKNNRLVSSGVVITPDKRRPHGFGIRETEAPYIADTIHESAGISFACAAIKRSIWRELEGLKKDIFPAQYNDSDFDIRCMKAGYKHLHVGSVSVFHEPGASEKRTKDMVIALHDKLCKLHPDMGQFHGREIEVRPLQTKTVRFDKYLPSLMTRSVLFQEKVRRTLSKLA